MIFLLLYLYVSNVFVCLFVLNGGNVSSILESFREKERDSNEKYGEK